MTLQEIMDYCLNKEGAEICFPFGDVPVCVKAGGKIFAEIYPREDNFKMTLRCDPPAGDYYRETWPGIALPGYHVPSRQRRFKNTVLLDKGLSDDIIREMIDHSHKEATLRARA